MPYQLGTLVDGSRLLWQLPWLLFRTNRTCCCCISQVTVFQGQSGILGSTPSHLSATVATLYMHPVCCGRQWGLPQSLADELKCLSTHPDSMRAYLWLFIPWFPIIQDIRLNPLEQPNCQYKGLIARAHEWSPATLLSSAHRLLWFILVSIQMVSVWAE